MPTGWGWVRVRVRVTTYSSSIRLVLSDPPQPPLNLYARQRIRALLEPGEIGNPKPEVRRAAYRLFEETFKGDCIRDD